MKRAESAASRRGYVRAILLSVEFVLLLVLTVAFPAVSKERSAGGLPPSGPYSGDRLPSDGQAAAQLKVKTQESTLQHRVTVTLKLVQVYVTDAKGKPALDLEKSDFILYDNRQAQKITDFERHVLPIAASELKETAPALPPARPAPQLLNRKFIFLIDFVRNDLEGIMKARTGALEFMNAKVQPGDEVALLSFSSVGGLTLHEYFTPDHDKVRAAIRKVRGVPGITPQSGDAIAPGHDMIGMELLNAEIFARHLGPDGASVRNLFAEITEWAKSLRYIPGQKNLILFSRGFGGSVARPGMPSSGFFEAMAKALASANVPVFAVNTTTTVADKIKLGVFPEPSLDELVRLTGGKYFPDVNYYSEIAEDIQDATANYYVLGYYVGEAWDGKFHDLKVEVRKPGYKVHAQKGYFNPLPFNKLSAIEKHLHLLDVAMAESSISKRSLDFPLTAVPFCGGRGGNVLLLSEIDVPKVQEAVGDRTEFISLIFNSNKALAEGSRAEVDWKAFKADKLYQYAMTVLAPGLYECRAVIRNLDDGRAAVGVCAVEVAEPAVACPALSSPLFLVPGSKAMYLNLAAEKGEGAAPGVSISEVFPFPPREYVPLVRALEQGQDSLFAGLRCMWEGARRGEISLSARLSPEGREEKQEVAKEILSSFSRDETDFYLIGFKLPDLPPGRYRLEIELLETATGSRARTVGGFSIRSPA